MDDAASRAAIFVTATGCCEILRPDHFLAMRDNAICCNIGHFDCEVDVAWLEKNGVRTNIKPQVRPCSPAPRQNGVRTGTSVLPRSQAEWGQDRYVHVALFPGRMGSGPTSSHKCVGVSSGRKMPLQSHKCY